ncbi:hypothetical protein AKO1_011498 [Acrasis kona]|uniref:Peptidase S54 rhomboid domain-containing protein n=1 Tax=Acrasis kona TaxID=1008807 RepID=A0AAW2Z2S9_9EUKA
MLRSTTMRTNLTKLKYGIKLSLSKQSTRVIIRKYSSFDPRQKMNQLISGLKGYGGRGGYGGYGNQYGFDFNSATNRLIAANVGVFLFITIIGNRDLLRKHFTINLNNMKEGRVYTMFTSAFCHEQLFHLLINMIVFYSFSNLFESMNGSKRLYLFYAITAAAGSTAFLLERSIKSAQHTNPRSPRKWFEENKSGVGASSVTMGLLSYAACVQPNSSILLFFVLPLTLRTAFVGIIAWAGWNVVV